jgi:hypothetical protein
MPIAPTAETDAYINRFSRWSANIIKFPDTKAVNLP